MSVIRVKTSQGIKRVKIAGATPTPEELALMQEIFGPDISQTPEEVARIRESVEFLPLQQANDMGGTQTMPMQLAPVPQPEERVPSYFRDQYQQPPVRQDLPDQGGTRPLPPAPVEQVPVEPPPVDRDIPEIKPDFSTPYEKARDIEYAKWYEQSTKGPGVGTVATRMFRPRFEGESQSSLGLAAPAFFEALSLTPEVGLNLLKTAVAIEGDDSDLAKMLGDAKSWEEAIARIPQPSEGFAPPRPKSNQELLEQEEPTLLNELLTGVFTNPTAMQAGLLQFTIPYITYGRAGLPSPLAAFATGATAMDTGEERLSNHLERYTPELLEPVRDYLEYKPGAESTLEGALKNGIEMGVLDAGISVLLKAGLKAHRAGKSARQRGQDPNEVLRNLQKNPNYDKQLELHAAVNLLDTAPPKMPGKLPPPKKAEIVAKKGGKIVVDRAKEDTLHASQYSDSRMEALAKMREARSKEAGFIKLGVDDFAETPIAQGALATKVKMDEFIMPLKDRIKNAHPKLGPRASTILDKFELEQNLLTVEAYAKVEPVLKAYSRMKGADKKLWNSAYKKGQTRKMFDIARRYENGVSGVDPAGKSLKKIKIPGFQQALRDSRIGFEQMHTFALKNAVKMGKVKDYFPMQIKDWEKFRRSIGRDQSELGYLIEQEMKKFAKENISKVSTTAGQPIDPKALDIDYFTGQVRYNGKLQPALQLPQSAQDQVVLKFMNAEPGGTIPRAAPFTQKRGNVKMTPEIEKHYMNFEEVVSQYPNKWAYEIARNRFQGKVPNFEHLGYVQRLMKMEKDLGIKDGSKAMGEIRDLIDTRLKAGERLYATPKGVQRHLDNAFKGYRDFVYLTTLGNPFSTITQTSEFGLNAFRNGFFNNLTGTKTAVLDNLPKFMQRALKHNNPGMRMKDLGLSDVGAEYAGAGTGLGSKSLNKMLNGGEIRGVKIPGAMNLAGFKKMDFIMKESNMNGALIKVQRQLRTAKGEKAFRDRMQPYYHDETDALIKGLKSGKKDDLTKLYLYQELAKTQPISLSEMPAKYLTTGGFGKSFYFLKSFGLKQLQTARRDVLSKLASGNKAEAAEGFYNLLSLGVLFGGGTMGQTMLKDWLLDRDNTTTSEYLLEAGMQLGGASRYQIMNFRRNDLPTAMWKTLKMPTPVIEELDHLFGEEGDFFRKTEKNLPLLGKYLYWTSDEGYGKEIMRKDTIRRAKETGQPAPPTPPSQPPPAPPKY